MHPAPVTSNETRRLAALRRLRVLDTAPERSFDNVVALAAQICVVPIGLVSLVDADRQWFKAHLGLDVPQTGRAESFCAHAIQRPDELMVVEDALHDPRFADNPLVTGPPGIRFYAGAPVLTRDGLALGTVCVIDRVPRHLEDWQLAALRTLARQVGRLLDHRGMSAEERAATLLGAGTAHADLDRLVSIAVSGDDLVAFVEPDLRCRFVNERFLEYWGLTRVEALERPLAEIIDAQCFEQQLRPLLDAGLRGEHVDVELVIDFPGRGARHVLVHVEPADAAGQVLGVVLRSRDVQPFMDRIATMAHTIEQLEQRTLRQEHMLHVLAHDLRGPLNAVLNFSGLAGAVTSGLRPEVRGYLDYVRQGGERMKLLIDDLQRYVGVGAKGLQLGDIDLATLVGTLSREQADSVRRLNARIELGALPVIRGDAALVRLMFRDLLANALRFTRPGVAPVVRVAAIPVGESWDLSVTDNGTGVPVEMRESIFDLFRRLNQDPVAPGTGLGLALCRRVAEQHGGTIHVEAGPGGVGSSFHVLWPRVPDAAADGR